MKLQSFIILIVGFLFLAVISFLCIGYSIPLIENDLQSEVSKAQSSEGLDWSQVSVVGQDVTLTGSAPSEALKIQAGNIARDTWGVVTVLNKLSVQTPDPILDAKPDEIIEAAQMASTPETTSSPYLFTMDFDGSDMHLQGSIPDEDTHTKLIALIEKQFGETQIRDELSINPQAPQQFTQTLLESVFPYLSDAKQANIRIEDQTLSVQAKTENSSRSEELKAGITGSLPDQYSSTSSIEVAIEVAEEKAPSPSIDIPAEESPSTTTSESIASADSNTEQATTLSAEQCQIQIQNIIQDKSIQFASKDTTLNQASYPLLDNIVETAGQCPSIHIDISGHTDNKGQQHDNLALSQARADAVADYMLAQGMSPAQLTATGHGELQPTASNDTEQGKAQNRRIEFIVRETL